MAPLGPLARVLVQAAVMGISILARALPAAYGAALQNARKNGGAAAAEAAKGGSILGRKTMPLDEAMLVLNLGKKEAVTAEAVQKQYDKYFAANAVDNGGSFYLQSKIYRAKEMLDEYIREQKKEEGKEGNTANDSKNEKNSQ